jgi:urease accessory protein
VGKTALMLALCRTLRDKYDIAAVTNDTGEDAHPGAPRGPAPDRIIGVETGGCRTPRSARMPDQPRGGGAAQRASHALDLILIESGGDNLQPPSARSSRPDALRDRRRRRGKIPRRAAPGSRATC